MKKREPDFDQLKKVFAREVPDRPVLYDLFFGDKYNKQFSKTETTDDVFTWNLQAVEVFSALGYDYASGNASRFWFPRKAKETKLSNSLNAGATITDWESFEQYKWPHPDDFSTDGLDKIKPFLPGNMKLMICGPMGVLENMIGLMGYDNLCIALYEEPELVETLSTNIGERLLSYYTTALQYDSVGGICMADDLGFNTQTLLSPEDLRKYVFPWHKRIVDVAHQYNKPCMLHACGYFENIIDDIVEMGFDARHSYEDNIMPVEEAYDKYGERISILGGIDMDFMCRETPENIARRCWNMLEKTSKKGGYALGTGNSVPDYIPLENYMAMVNAVMEY